MEENNVNTLPHMSDEIPAMIYMTLALGEAPISGGWGYTRDDAVVIETDDPMKGVAFEYDFIEHRTHLEVAEIDGDCYIGEFKRLQQSLEFHDDVPYDVVTCCVTLVNDDDETIGEHTVQCWFNIKQFFGNY